jgi:hypothetical protein
VARRYDIALAEDKFGRTIVHRADCPEVRQLAADGEMVCTMWGCEGIPDDLPWHDCLKSDITGRGAPGRT